MQDADWLSASAVAALLGICQRTVRRAIARGALPAAKRAGVYRIAPEELEHYRERRHLGGARSGGALLIPGRSRCPNLGPRLPSRCRAL